MLELTHSNGFYVRSDGRFWAHAGDVILKAEKRGDTFSYPFKAQYSTPDLDREKEVAIQKGLNFEPFKEHGEFNWNHITHATVGLPTGNKAWLAENGWGGQGEIIKSMPIWPGYDTDMVVAQHNQFKKGGFQRGLCCSIEGKVTKRSTCGRYIEKADVFNVALTFRPINPNCNVSLLSKSFRGEMPIIEGDSFYKAMEIETRLEDRTPVTVDPAKLVDHLVKKGYSVNNAERHVYKFLWNRQGQQRRV